jgi:calcium-binding protein CML
MAASYGHGSRPSAHMYQGQHWLPYQHQQQQCYNCLNSYNPRAPAPAAPEFYQTVAPAAAFNGQQQGGGGGGGGSSSYGQSPFGSGSARPPQMYPPPQRPLFPPDTDPEIVTEFSRADMNQNGTIEAAELKWMLSSQDNPFSHRTVRLMLHLFAENRADTSRIGPLGFVPLWKELKQWQSTFEEFDTDRSKSIELKELEEAIKSIGYCVPDPVLQLLMSKYDFTGQNRSISYDSFIECGLIVKGLSDNFKELDGRDSGFATLSYEKFMLTVLPFIVA